MSIAIIVLCLVVVLGLSSTILWIWALIDIARNDAMDSSNKVIWVLIVVFFPFIGSIAYLVAGRTQGRKAV